MIKQMVLDRTNFNKKLTDLTQENLDITGYCTNARRLWEELSALDANTQSTCVCICGGKNKMQNAEQDRRLIQFLIVLNEIYTVVRGSILMMNPPPTMAQAFSILIQEQKQREVRLANRLHLESTSLVVINYSAGTSGYKTTGASSSNGAFKTNYAPAHTPF